MKPTQAQATILHVVLSTAVATIIGASTAATQFYFNHGQDLWLALVFFGGSLPATFGTLRYAVWHAIQTSPALAQAEVDTKNEILDFLSNEFSQFVGGNLNGLSQQVKSLEVSIANHSHAPLPTPVDPSTLRGSYVIPKDMGIQLVNAPAPSQVPQLAFPNQPSVPFQQVTSGPATFTNYDANVHLSPGTASVPSPSLVVTQSAPQPQAPMLGTIPTLQAVQPQ